MSASDPTTTEGVPHPEGEEAKDEDEALRAYLPASFGKQIVTRNGAGPYLRLVMKVRDAHVPETCTAGLAFSSDGRLLVTRGEDQCIKRTIPPSHPPPTVS